MARLALPLALAALLAHCGPPAPPVYGEVPAFTLVGADGADVSSAALRGHAYVTSFFFTRCSSICPVLMRSMKALEEASAREGLGALRLVSISVDPSYDTPERLRAYGEAIGIDAGRWSLLTGDEDAIKRLALEGFRVPMGERSQLAGGLIDIAHTGKLVLVDGAGRIRGYFDANETGRGELLRVLRAL